MRCVKYIYCCILYIVTTCSFRVYAQKNTISADSLLSMIQKDGSVFKTFEHASFLAEIDIKDCYYNDSLKVLMLKLLDEEAYREYDNKRFISSWMNNDESRRNETRKWLEKHKKYADVDSIMSNASLYYIYEDSAIVDLANEIGATRKPETEPEYEKVLSLIKWPEIYEEYHRQWVKDGSRIGGNRFFAMLSMHAPDALAKSDGQCERWYASNDYLAIKQTLYESPNLFFWGTYAIRLTLKSLTCTSQVALYDFGNDEKMLVPFNVRQLQFLKDFTGKSFFEGEYVHTELNQIREKLTNPNIMMCETWPKLCDEISKDPLPVSQNSLSLFLPEECFEKLGQEIRDNVDVFVIEYESYINEMELQELYWKQNMPYYNKTEK